MEPANPSNQYHYNPALQPLARRLRNQGTKAEACLWKSCLRAKQMRGHAFRRQRPILNYIVDFVCLPLRLVIEVDGYTHQFEEVQQKDLAKAQSLADVGFNVLRVTDHDVLPDLASVSAKIEQVVQALESQANGKPS